MNFTERINQDIKNAMLAKEKERLAVLRDIKSKLLLEATSGGSGELTEEAANKIVLKLHKQRMETYQIYVEQGRNDLAEEELFQLRKKFIASLKNVLPASKIIKLKRAEDKFSKKLLQQIRDNKR